MKMYPPGTANALMRGSSTTRKVHGRLGRSDEADSHLARSGAVALQPRAQRALVAAYLETGHLTQARGLLESIPLHATNAAWARARLRELAVADG